MWPKKYLMKNVITGALILSNNIRNLIAMKIMIAIKIVLMESSTLHLAWEGLKE